MSLTSVDLPEPLTPVTAMNCPSGKPTVRLRRLCSRAPCTTSSRPGVCGRRVAGVGIDLRPDRYAPVGDSGLASRPSTEPLCTIRPRSEEHTSELQSRQYLVCRLLLEK